MTKKIPLLGLIDMTKKLQEAETAAPTDPNADLADTLAYLKQMADDARKIAAILVAHERRGSAVDHGRLSWRRIVPP